MSYIQKRGKNTAWREALLRNLATELVIHEKLTLTQQRALWVQPIVENLVTLAKSNTLQSRRRAAQILRPITTKNNESALTKLFDKIGPRYNSRSGGYTQILKLADRRGDAAPTVIIKFV